jgi:DNA-directed RNA polymerase subunit RPC12/RpoP
MFRLYVKCPYCNSIFPSGFQAESPIQVLGLSYLCEKCRRIFPCPPPNYLKKVDGNFEKAMKKEEVFALPPAKGVLLSGLDLIEFKKQVILRSGTKVGSNKAFVVFRGENNY